MARTTRLLRRVIRRKALWNGLLGPSKFWRVVAVWVFGKATLKRFFGKNVEQLDVSKFGPGHYLSVETAKPLTGRRARKLAKSGATVPTKAALAAAARAELAAQRAVRS